MQDMVALVEPLVPGLRRYARSLLRDHAAADDLVQDCLEKTIARWHQRSADGNARTWVFTILHNLALNRLRQTRRRGPHIVVDDLDEALLASAATQEAGLHHQDIVAAIARLPEDQRAVLLLVSVEDLSYAEAAEAIGVPVGTVMSRLSRARARLREELDGGAAGVPVLRSVK